MGDINSEDAPEATENTNVSKSRIREKNRQAQRRFRERQRTLVNELRVQVDLLCRTLKEKQTSINRLEHENRLMKTLLMKYTMPGGQDGDPMNSAPGNTADGQPSGSQVPEQAGAGPS